MKKNYKQILSLKLREKILRIAARTNSRHSHIGSCFSCIDLLIETELFQMNDKDKLVLSKSHASLALYVVLNKKGKLSDKDLNSYFEEGGYFGIHTPFSFPKEIPIGTGSLGHGLSFAGGIAKGYNLQNQKSRKVYCVLSDGECNEGATWEAALFISQHKLNNLIIIIDKNRFQGIDASKNVLGDSATIEKWRSFGFNVIEGDGHSFRFLEKAFKKISEFTNKRPSVIIANTKRGKGLKSIEDKMLSNYFFTRQDNIESIISQLKET